MTPARCVIVAGLSRSGTSWLAKGLSFAPGFTYYREPDNYERAAEAQERFAWLYLTTDQDDAEYGALMTRDAARVAEVHDVLEPSRSGSQREFVAFSGQCTWRGRILPGGRERA